MLDKRDNYCEVDDELPDDINQTQPQRHPFHETKLNFSIKRRFHSDVVNMTHISYSRIEQCFECETLSSDLASDKLLSYIFQSLQLNMSVSFKSLLSVGNTVL